MSRSFICICQRVILSTVAAGLLCLSLMPESMAAESKKNKTRAKCDFVFVFGNSSDSNAVRSSLEGARLDVSRGHCAAQEQQPPAPAASPQPFVYDDCAARGTNGSTSAVSGSAGGVEADAIPASVLTPNPGQVWSLPIAGQIRSGNEVPSTVVHVSKPKKLDAGICMAQGSRISGRLDDLLGAALERDENVPVVEKALRHYNTKTQRIIAETKDATNYLIPYRGFGPSIEAADIVLDEKLKVKSKAAAELAYQKQLDRKHLKLVECMMQMAAGMGMSDQTKGFELTNEGLDSLKQLVGDEEAEKTMAMLSEWRNQLMIPESVYAQGAWHPAQHQAKLTKVRENSLDNDLIIKQITDRLHKYNQKGKLSRVSSQVIQTTLGAASLTPTFAGPGAKLALLAYIMATGGPEQCKVLKALYLDKRLESRWRVLNEESHLALENYQLGILTRNPLLLAMSESLVEEMSGADTVQDVFGVRIFYESGRTSSHVASGNSAAAM